MKICSMLCLPQGDDKDDVAYSRNLAFCLSMLTHTVGEKQVRKLSEMVKFYKLALTGTMRRARFSL